MEWWEIGGLLLFACVVVIGSIKLATCFYSPPIEYPEDDISEDPDVEEAKLQEAIQRRERDMVVQRVLSQSQTRRAACERSPILPMHRSRGVGGYYDHDSYNGLDAGDIILAASVLNTIQEEPSYQRSQDIERDTGGDSGGGSSDSSGD